MKKNNWILSCLFLIILSVLFLVACNEELSNPSLKDNEIKIYLKGSGSTVSLLASQGYNVEVGDSVVIDLQISPANETTCKWIDSNDSILINGVRFVYKPSKIEQKKIRFVVERTNGYADTILFKFNGVITGLEGSEFGIWKESPFLEVQTGEFEGFFTINTNGDQVNSVIGIGQGGTTSYSNLSCLIRFNMITNPGKIDVFKGDLTGSGSYLAENQIIYEAFKNYKLKIHVNVITQTYSVWIEQNGTYVALATDYHFRAPATKLTSWALYSDGAQRGNGTIGLNSKSVTTISQNKFPLFDKVNDITNEEGKVFTKTIKVSDPLGGVVKIKAKEIPRFATLTDNGDNTALIRFSPYANCGGCDIGVHNIIIEGMNAMETSELSFKVVITEKTNKITLNADVTDAAVYDQTVQAIQPLTASPTLVIGKGLLPGSATVFAHSAAVIPFAIPVIEVGMKVINATLSVNVELNNAWKNVRYDLYGLPARMSSTVLNLDYYMSGSVDSSQGVSLIQGGFVVNNMVSTGPVGIMKSDANGSANLVNYINALVTNAPAGSKYFFLRVNANRSDLDNWIRLNFSSAETLTPPSITLTFGPK